MVDYAIVIQSDKELTGQIRQSLQRFSDDHQNINHTAYPALKVRPIVISVEAKVQGAGKYELMVQLSIWVAAHFKKLEMLREAKSTDISLPLISIDGHDWRLHMACQGADGSIVSVLLCARLDAKVLTLVVTQSIVGKQNIGGTSSIVDIYKLLSFLRILAHWSHEEYLPWFKDNILGTVAFPDAC